MFNIKPLIQRRKGKTTTGIGLHFILLPLVVFLAAGCSSTRFRSEAQPPGYGIHGNFMRLPAMRFAANGKIESRAPELDQCIDGHLQSRLGSAYRTPAAAPEAAKAACVRVLRLLQLGGSGLSVTNAADESFQRLAEATGCDYALQPFLVDLDSVTQRTLSFMYVIPIGYFIIIGTVPVAQQETPDRVSVAGLLVVDLRSGCVVGEETFAARGKGDKGSAVARMREHFPFAYYLFAGEEVE